MKRFNKNEFIWFIILGFNLIFLSYMVISNKIFLIINEDMKIYSYIAIVIITLMLIVQLGKVFTIGARGGIRGGYVIFFFSALCLVTLTKINIVTTSMEFKGVNLYHENHMNTLHKHDEHVERINENIICIGKDNFHSSLEEIINHIDEYVGKEITIEGLVYNDSKYENKFIVTSIDMNCCIVDSTYLGILCDYKGINIETGITALVKGKIEKVKITSNYGKDIWVPMIKVSEVTTINSD